MKLFRRYCQSSKTLLWLWIMLCSIEVATKYQYQPVLYPRVGPLIPLHGIVRIDTHAFASWVIITPVQDWSTPFISVLQVATQLSIDVAVLVRSHVWNLVLERPRTPRGRWSTWRAGHRLGPWPGLPLRTFPSSQTLDRWYIVDSSTLLPVTWEIFGHNGLRS